MSLIRQISTIVDSSISDNLLGKFPDNSAFGFDYSQSALWSPLPVRRFHHLCYVAGQISTTPNSLSSGKRRLSFENERRKKVTLSKIKNKIHSFAHSFDLHSRRLKFDGVKETESDSPPAIKKGWEKVLRVTSKQFKKTESDSPPAIKKGWEKVLKVTSKQFKRKKKKDPTVRVKLSDYLQSQNY